MRGAQTLLGHSYPWASSDRRKPSSSRECISLGFRGIRTGPRVSKRQQLRRVGHNFAPEWLLSIRSLSPCSRRCMRNPRPDQSYAQKARADWDQFCFPRPRREYDIVRIESKLMVSFHCVSSTGPGSARQRFGPTLKRFAPFLSSPRRGR